MAIPFLNNINLSDNELQNAKLHVTSTVPAAEAGQIYFNSTQNVARYHNGTTWVDIPRKISVGGTDLAYSQAIDLAAGTNVGIAESLGVITISSTDEFEGTVKSITAGVGLNGGTITTSGTIALDYNGSDNYIIDNPNGGDIADAYSKINFHDDNDGDVYYTELGEIPVEALVDVKNYIDSSVAGGLIYQGGYDASTDTTSPGNYGLQVPPIPNNIKKGWTYTVTVDGAFFGEQLRVGDVLIAEIDAPTSLADWTTVQNNIDLASLTQVGIGNVKESTANELKGIDVTYNTSGTAFVGLDIEGLALDSLVEQPSDYYLPIYDVGNDINNKAKLSELLAFANSVTSKAYTITDTATITYPFTLTAATQNDTIIQLVDTVTNETVYADVDRISTTQATITFAATPTNSVRVLVQKIG